jgi:hypothetical protein
MYGGARGPFGAHLNADALKCDGTTPSTMTYSASGPTLFEGRNGFGRFFMLETVAQISYVAHIYTR